MTRFLFIVKNEYIDTDDVFYIYSNGKIPLHINSEESTVVACHLFDITSKRELLKQTDQDEWTISKEDFENPTEWIEHVLELTYDGDMLFGIKELK